MTLDVGQNGLLTGTIFADSSFATFRCDDDVCTKLSVTTLPVAHRAISNYAFVGGSAPQSGPSLILSERGHDVLRHVTCDTSSCSSTIETILDRFRYRAWRATDGTPPQIVAEVSAPADDVLDLIAFECSTRRCDESAARTVVRSIHGGHLSVVSGDNQFWIANAAAGAADLRLHRCDSSGCAEIPMPHFDGDAIVDIAGAYAGGTVWFAVTQDVRGVQRNTVTFVSCRGDYCGELQSPLDDEPVSHLRMAAGLHGPIVTYTDEHDGSLRVARCGVTGCGTGVVVTLGTPYSVIALREDRVAIAYNDASGMHLALCKDETCVTRPLAGAHRRTVEPSAP